MAQVPLLARDVPAYRRFMFGLLGENALSKSSASLTISTGYVQGNNRRWGENRFARQVKRNDTFTGPNTDRLITRLG
jgi:hypothetical protein